MLKAFLCYNAFCIPTTISTTLYHYSPSQFSVKCITTSSSNSNSFSPESAIKASNQVGSKNPKNPKSFFTFLRTHGFTDSEIQAIIENEPELLSCDPSKILLPKFQFLRSKGASTSDIVRITVYDYGFRKLSLRELEIKFEFFLSKGVSSSEIVSLLTRNPLILQASLEKQIIPLFELLSGYLKIRDVIICLIRKWFSFDPISYDLIVENINLMNNFGVSNYNIATLFRIRPSIFGSNDLIKSLEEVKGLGFKPSRTTFGAALVARKCISKELWNQKVDVFKKWGWSEETVLQEFRSCPSLMLVSIDKIDAVMNFWVKQMGWNSLLLTKYPLLFTHSLSKRIIPRAFVLQYLLMKGLREKSASLCNPFNYTEKVFLEKCVFKYKGESDYLLKLYEEKMKLAYSGKRRHATD
ncbi:hypothetical protein P8452_16678 [Trifolium repens]|nr:hypothetical protein P8452_16678 [Trifolium repens]